MPDERRRSVLRQAYELARSGLFDDEQAIATALAQDHPEAREWLSNPFVGDGLRQVCNLARAERGEAHDRFDA